jgi:pyrroloquinoline quinone biosynthesis protein B
MSDLTTLRVLGSSAGGGFPQWNCNCANCRAVRAGDPALQARTQSSIAWTRNGQDWLLFNASPDILTQLKSQPQLQPARRLRDSGIAAVVLMDAQIDHVTGLLMLRERGTPLPLYATPEVLSDIGNGFPLTDILSHYCGTQAHPLPIDGTASRWDFLPDACMQPFSLSSKPPPYSPYRNAPRPGDNIGVCLVNERRNTRLFYAPGLAQVSDDLLALMATCNVVLVDGTFWTNDEMIDLGLGSKRALDMGHLPQSGEGGMIERLSLLPAGVRKVLIHINNTNPILRAGSAERAQLTQAGIEVAYDGMEIAF